MKIIGENDKDQTVIVVMNAYDWDIIQKAAEVPMDKRSRKVGAQADSDPIARICNVLIEAKGMRRELGSVQKKWDALAARLDTVMDK